MRQADRLLPNKIKTINNYNQIKQSFSVSIMYFYPPIKCLLFSIFYRLQYNIKGGKRFILVSCSCIKQINKK